MRGGGVRDGGVLRGENHPERLRSTGPSDSRILQKISAGVSVLPVGAGSLDSGAASAAPALRMTVFGKRARCEGERHHQRRAARGDSWRYFLRWRILTSKLTTPF